MEAGIESTVCVLVVVVVVVKWVFGVLETSRVSQQGQQFTSQQGGREGRGWQTVSELYLPTHHCLLPKILHQYTAEIPHYFPCTT